MQQTAQPQMTRQQPVATTAPTETLTGKYLLDMHCVAST